MFSISMPELILILIIALIIFGPSKLPEVVKAIGKALSEFKKAKKDFDNECQDEKPKENENKDEK